MDHNKKRPAGRPQNVENKEMEWLLIIGIVLVLVFLYRRKK
jgi:hypothetical protein